MVRETSLSITDLIAPLFVTHGEGIKEEIGAIPGLYHHSIDTLVHEVKELYSYGIPAVLLFGIPHTKDPLASEAYNPEGIVQRAIREIKDAIPEMIVIGDVCMCEYTEHGHCGIIEEGYLANDASLDLLKKITLSQVRAGADIVAPAAMLDGQIGAMRSVLEENGYSEKVIMSYSAKYASKLFDPFFKDGTNSSLAFGDKKTHQMDYGNSDEALREIGMDLEEGADIVMVKPALFYLDIVNKVKQKYQVPLAVYNVSGEYAMVKAAAQKGTIDEKQIVMEILTSMKRAGADLIITYHAKEVARSFL